MVRHPPLVEEASEVAAYAQSAAFNMSNTKDMRLYAEANSELDRRWTLDQDYLDLQLATYRSMLARAQSMCSDVVRQTLNATATTSRGALCYWLDNGCGYACLDENFSDVLSV